MREGPCNGGRVYAAAPSIWSSITGNSFGLIVPFHPCTPWCLLALPEILVSLS